MFYIRYQMYGDWDYEVEWDMTEKRARSLFAKLKESPMCLWAELMNDHDEDVDCSSYEDCEKCDECEHNIPDELVDDFDHDKSYAEFLAGLGARPKIKWKRGKYEYGSIEKW